MTAQPLPSELRPCSKRIDRKAILLYARITDDFNPIHVDEEFAAQSPMGGIIAHGMLSLNLIFQSLRATLGNAGSRDMEVAIRFTKPVRIDDMVTAGGSLTDAATGRYEVWVRNQAGEAVIAGSASPVAGRGT